MAGKISSSFSTTWNHYTQRFPCTACILLSGNREHFWVKGSVASEAHSSSGFEFRYNLI